MKSKYSAAFIAFSLVLSLILGAMPAGAGTVPEPIKLMSESEKTVYLTFDDGPDSVNTPNVMNILLEYDVPATFFFTGINMKNFPSVVKEVYDNGFTIGLHAYAHGSLAKMSSAGIKKDLESTNDVLEGITGERSAIVRPPYGAVNNNVKSTLASLGFTAYLWSIDPRDWAPASTDVSVVQNIKQNLKPGAMILLHASASHPRAARILPEIIEYIQSEGYQMKALPDSGFKTVSAKLSDTSVIINGKPLGAFPYVINGSNYIKARDFARALNGTEKQFGISWNEKLKRIIILSGTSYNGKNDGATANPPKTRRAVPSRATLTIDGKPARVTVYTIDGSNYLSLGEFARALGVSFRLDSKKNVNITVALKR